MNPHNGTANSKQERRAVRHKRTASFKGDRAKIQAYVTPEEKTEIERAAEREGMGVSGFASRVVLTEARRVLAEQPFLPRKKKRLAQ